MLRKKESLRWEEFVKHVDFKAGVNELWMMTVENQERKTMWQTQEEENQV